VYAEIACFLLGVNVAQYVHGIGTDKDDHQGTVKLFRVLREIADESLTLINGLAEMSSDLPLSDQIALDASQRRIRAHPG
jgi:hypothetical protein